MSNMLATTSGARRTLAAATDKVEIVLGAGENGQAEVTGLIRLASDGKTVTAIRSNVTLREDRKECWNLPTYTKGDDGKWQSKAVTSVTALGYDRLNQFVGMSFKTPETCAGPDGRRVNNPYFHYRGDDLEYVTVRLIGVARNAVGNLVFNDRTLTFRLATYFAQDIYAKWSGKKSEATTKTWGELFSRAALPEQILTDAKRKLISIPGDLVLVVDLAQKEVVNCIGEHINREKFAERIAFTICRRNILKAFTGISVLDATRKATVTSWVTQDNEIAAAVSDSDPMPDGAIIDPTTEEVSDPDLVNEVAEAETDETAPHEPDGEAGDSGPASVTPTETAEPAAPAIDAQAAALRQQVRQFRLRLSSAAFEYILGKRGIEPKALGDCNDAALLSAVLADLETAHSAKGGVS